MPTLFLSLLRAGLSSHAGLVAENLALHQQLAILHRRSPRARLRRGDRAFWVVPRWLWFGWQEALVLVQPTTVLRRHREGFRLYWRRRSRARALDRPRTDAELRKLIGEMREANPLWSAPRIHGEPLKLGIEISQRTVGRVMGRKRGPPSQTWRTFLDNHAKDLAWMDFFVVPTAGLRLLSVLVILRHDRGRIVHVNATTHAAAEWTARQVLEAFPWDETPRLVISDNDGIYRDAFTQRVRGMGIEEIMGAPRWQSRIRRRGRSLVPMSSACCRRALIARRTPGLGSTTRLAQTSARPCHPHRLGRLASDPSLGQEHVSSLRSGAPPRMELNASEIITLVSRKYRPFTLDSRRARRA